MDMNTKRLEVEKSYRDAAADWYLKQAEERYRVHQQRLASMTSAIDDDTEDDATGESRARLRAESAARRQAQDDALRSANALYFAIINKTQSKTDSKVWDDGEGSAGAARSIVAAQSRARKEAERHQLEEDNASRVMRLSQLSSAVVRLGRGQRHFHCSFHCGWCSQPSTNQTQKREGQHFTLKNRNSSAVSLNAIILTRPRERARRPLALGRALGLA
jgi:hypothetical protein